MNGLNQTSTPRGFSTQRLRVECWTGCLAESRKFQSLVKALQPILTPNVLYHLPDPLQLPPGQVSVAAWIRARQAESDVYLIRDMSSRALLGLLILAEMEAPGGPTTLHLGYLFGETAWGKGFASEMLRGLVAWRGGRDGPVRLIAGVGKANPASARVLEKAGFLRDPQLSDRQTDMFRRDLGAMAADPEG